MIDTNLVEVVMAAVSVGFIGFAASYALKLRSKVSAVVLIAAVSVNMYKHLVLILGFTLAITVVHLVAHAVEYVPISPESDLAIHLTLDLMLILVSVSIYYTFRQAYGMVQGGLTGARIANDIRKALDKEVQDRGRQ